MFNETNDPKRDTTATFTPAVGLRLNAGPTLLTGRVGAQYIYFVKYEQERSLGTSNDIRCEVPLGRLTPFVEATYGETSNRVGFEIDGRVRQKGIAYGAGTKLEVSGRTTITGRVRRATTTFDDSEVFRSVQLSSALDRTSDELTLEFRYGLTPLTTVVVAASGGNDRFDGDGLRDSDTYRTQVGLEFTPFALISGSVFFGVLKADARNPELPDAQTFTSSGDLTYHMGSTSVSVGISRDRFYSFESTSPYYFLTDTTVSLTQRIGGPWDVVVRGERGTLLYKSIDSGETRDVSQIPERTDDLVGYGAGVGYRIGSNLRFGVDVQRMERRSARPDASFRRTRIGGSFAYELGQ